MTFACLYIACEAEVLPEAGSYHTVKIVFGNSFGVVGLLYIPAAIKHTYLFAPPINYSGLYISGQYALAESE